MKGVTIHTSADVQSTRIGEGTAVWQNCVILSGARIGRRCNINSHVFVENDVEVGDDVTIKCGVQIWDGMRIEDKVFIGPNVSFTNDLRPRAGQRPARFLRTTIREGASIGANSTIVGGRTIGKYAMIGAGSVVTHDVPDQSLWYGNPARFRGWVCRCGARLDKSLRCQHCNEQTVPNDESASFPSSEELNHTRRNGMGGIGKISDTCIIHANVRIGRDVTISDGAIIYDNVEIGDRTHVGPGCILGEPLMDHYRDPGNYTNPRLIIGANSILRSNTVVYAGSVIGSGFNTGHHATIREHTVIGKNCTLGSYGDIQGFVEIGDHCRFHSSVHIGQYSVIKNFVFIFPYAVLTNDPHPPSDSCIKGPTLHDYSVISAGAILMPGITIGRESVVGANSLVNKDVEAEKVVLGIPARPVCTIHDIRCREGNLEKPYPWRNHFSRGMPWRS